MIEKYTIKSAHLLSQNVIPIAFNHSIFNENTAIAHQHKVKKQKASIPIFLLLYALIAKYINAILAISKTSCSLLIVYRIINVLSY